MSLPVTSYGAPQFQPGISADAFIPDQLLAGDLKVVTKNVTVTGGAVYKRGTVLGKITASGKFTISLSAAADGSQNPCAILVDDVDTTGGDVQGGAYQMGEFNGNALILGTGQTLPGVTTALEAFNIYVKGQVSAADPS